MYDSSFFAASHVKVSGLRGAGASLIIAFAVLVGVSKCAGADLFPSSASFLAGRMIRATQIQGSPAQPRVKQGAYPLAGGTVYVGIEAEPPDHPTVEFYDERTGRTGTLKYILGAKYQPDGSPPMEFVLDSPISLIAEKAFVIEDGSDRLGASLWYAPGSGQRPTIVLIHGADDETREMGFLIPYFVSHGLNVVAYDQRGTGESTGNWRFTSDQ